MELDLTWHGSNAPVEARLNHPKPWVFDFAARTAATRAHNLQRFVHSILHDTKDANDENNNETDICSIRLYLASNAEHTLVELTINPASNMTLAKRVQWHGAWAALKQQQKAYLAALLVSPVLSQTSLTATSPQQQAIATSPQQQAIATNTVVNKVKLQVSRYSLADLAIWQMQECCESEDAIEVYKNISSAATKHDRRVYMALASYGKSEALMVASQQLRANKEFVLAAFLDRLDNHMCPVGYICATLWNDREFVAKLLDLYPRPELLGWASVDIRADREIVLSLVKHSNGMFLEFAAPALRSDREVVMAAVRQNSFALQFASANLRADRDCVLAGISYLGFDALQYASDELRGDAAFVSEYAAAVSSRHELKERNFLCNTNTVLPYVASGLKSNREFVLARVTKNGKELEHASPNLRNDFGVVMAAVQSCGAALKYASASLQDNVYCALAAARHSQSGFEFASPRMRNTKDVALAAVRRCFTLNYIQKLGPDCVQDVDVWRAGIQKSWRGVRHAPDTVLQHKDIALSAASQSCRALYNLPQNFKKDVDVVLASLRAQDACQYFAVEWIAEFGNPLLDNEQVVFEAASVNWKALDVAAPKFRDNYKVVLAAVKNNGAALSLASDTLRNNFQIVMTAVSNCGAALQHASASLRGNLQLARAAVANDIKAATWVCGKARKEIMKQHPSRQRAWRRNAQQNHVVYRY